MGNEVGAAVGDDGAIDGCIVGSLDGAIVGMEEGAADGTVDGLLDGDLVGTEEGAQGSKFRSINADGSCDQQIS